MTPRDNSMVRYPSRLELLFYQEMLAPLRHYSFACQGDSNHLREMMLLTQRFKKDVERYGYILTEGGPMMLTEPDFIHNVLDADVQRRVAVDLQVLRRLRQR